MSRSIKAFYYITHISNLESILKHGILSHAEMNARGFKPYTIYDNEIVSNRSYKLTPDGRSLWMYANLYLQPRNPMLFRVLRETQQSVVILEVDKKVLEMAHYLTTGNAASHESEFRDIRLLNLRDIVKEIAPFLELEYWSKPNGTHRKIMAECLIPDKIPPEYIKRIYTPKDNGLLDDVRRLLARLELKVEAIFQPTMFFQPESQFRVTDDVSLAKGDMFFSKMQTLTISVNTVGIMGKGLASRAKYQFPDVYVTYQDLCKKKELTVGRPALIKRETSLADSLADVPFGSDAATWFLMFPTKQHWKENSKIEYIVNGLDMLLKSYQNLGIKSIALPALGCGLGNLEWKDVGPLMCQTLQKMRIPVCIYLPVEHKIDPEYLDSRYLLSHKS